VAVEAEKAAVVEVRAETVEVKAAVATGRVLPEAHQVGAVEIIHGPQSDFEQWVLKNGRLIPTDRSVVWKRI
jgi:hypothetical protein